ncbi:hypothetical protein FQN54_006814 [Arachnomyces sp. PD_36]|nr:hypothetical protein FQN54_006814 [Arachnomyces sp. PD_36]
MNLRAASKGYKPVLESQDLEDGYPERETKASNLHMCFSALNIAFFVFSFWCLIISAYFYVVRNDRPNIVYSPAYEAVELQPVLFDGALDAINIYKGEPNPELDSAWKDLYEVDPFLVTPEELRKINKTSIEAPARPGYYLAKLAVHHQLHCLDHIRRSIRPDYYKVDESKFQVSNIDHVDHCIDMLRQAIQCHADTTLITFDWGGPGTPTEPNFCSTHACNNFEKINQWAKSRQFSVSAALEAQQEASRQELEGVLKEYGALPTQ